MKIQVLKSAGDDWEVLYIDDTRQDQAHKIDVAEFLEQGHRVEYLMFTDEAYEDLGKDYPTRLSESWPEDFHYKGEFVEGSS